MTFLHHISTQVPDSTISQEEFTSLHASLTNDDLLKRKIRFLTSKTAINQRFTVFSAIEKLKELSLSKKMEIYQSEAVSLAIKAIEKNEDFAYFKDKITDIIIVSCTGMQAPGIEFQIIKHFELQQNIHRLNINLMGCYASITGLRMAKQICENPVNVVLMVSVELCTLHFQQRFDDDYLLSNALFSDGAAAVIVSNEKHNAKLKLVDFESRIVPQTSKEMSWRIDAAGFQMTLSGEVPKSISQSLHAKKLFDLTPQNVDWAIHPGGKQIIDGIKDVLALTENDVTISREILRNYGNMSSATILFVLQAFAAKKEVTHKALIACAFGPGLTIESALLNYV